MAGANKTSRFVRVRRAEKKQPRKVDQKSVQKIFFLGRLLSS
jgi:hypothetical protein